MLLKSIFMIRAGGFGEDFGIKLIMSLIGLGICIYDWRINDRNDYFWVFITGTLIWSLIELILQFGGTRIIQEKNLFGLDVTNALWLTISLQGMSEGAFVAVIGMIFGDRLLNEEIRKKWSVIYLLALMTLLPLYIPRGINFTDVNIGDLSIPSRRDMFPLSAIIFIVFMCVIAIIWLITTTPRARKRGIYMYFVMASFIAWWNLLEWLTGQRFIEIGTLNSDGTYTNLSRAPPFIEFLAIAYDALIEVSLIYVPFLAIPYWLNLIEKEEEI